MEIYREIEKNTVDGTLWPCGVAPSMALVKSAYFTYPVDGASPVFNAMNFDPGVYYFTLFYIALYSVTLYHIRIQYIVLSYVTLHSIPTYYIIFFDTVLYCMTLYHKLYHNHQCNTTSFEIYLQHGIYNLIHNIHIV